jgi:hypothetical protein
MGAAGSMRRTPARNRVGRDRRASAAIPSLFSPITAELMAAIEPLLGMAKLACRGTERMS